MLDDPIASGLLERWFAGECDRAQIEAIERWIADVPGRATLVALMRAAWEEARVARGVEALTPADMRIAWHKVAGRVRAQERGRRSLVLHSPTAPSRVRRVRLGWSITLAGLAASLVLTLALPGVRRQFVEIWRPMTRVYTTARAEQATIALDDGTRVELAPETRVTVGTAFSRHGRDVVLDGEALFDVQRDSLRPFRVHTAHGVTTDIGTVFAVRDYAGDHAARIAVREGAVAIETGDTLRRGDLAVVTGRGGAVRSHPTSAPAELAWTDGRLVFSGAPLSEVMTTLARWYDVQVHLDSALAGRPVTTTVTVREPLDTLLHELSAALRIQCSRRGRAVVVTASDIR